MTKKPDDKTTGLQDRMAMSEGDIVVEPEASNDGDGPAVAVAQLREVIAAAVKMAEELADQVSDAASESIAGALDDLNGALASVEDAEAHIAEPDDEDTQPSDDA